MICSLFNFFPQSAQSRRRKGALVGLAPKQSSKYPNWNMKHYKSAELLSILECQAHPHKRKSPRLKTF